MRDVGDLDRRKPPSATLAGVLLVDEDSLTRRAVASLLGHAGAAGIIEARSADEAVSVLRGRRVALIVSEYTLPDMAFPAFAAAAGELNPGASLVVLTGESDGTLLHAAAGTPGVVAVLSKYGETELLSQRILLAGRGGLILDGAVWRILSRQHRSERHQWASLPEREIQVLTLIDEGFSLIAIARRLGLAESTVKTHASRAAVRLGARTSKEAAALAGRLGLLRDTSATAGPRDDDVIDLRASRRQRAN